MDGSSGIEIGENALVTKKCVASSARHRPQVILGTHGNPLSTWAILLQQLKQPFFVIAIDRECDMAFVLAGCKHIGTVKSSICHEVHAHVPIPPIRDGQQHSFGIQWFCLLQIRLNVEHVWIHLFSLESATVTEETVGVGLPRDEAFWACLLLQPSWLERKQCFIHATNLTRLDTQLPIRAKKANEHTPVTVERSQHHAHPLCQLSVTIIQSKSHSHTNINNNSLTVTVSQYLDA